MNFICPPDLFRYCYNNVNTTLQNVISDCTQRGRTNASYTYGLYGRVPGYIFKTLTNVNNIVGVFSNNDNLTPYTWRYGNEYGQMFSPNLLSNNKSLKNISYLFSGLIIPSNVIMPATLLSNNQQLTNVSNLFDFTRFEGPADEVQQMPDSFFSFNRNLQDISCVFRSHYSPEVYIGIGPKKIGSTLFTSDKHKNINNVNKAFYNQANTTGSVPQFWNWLGGLNNSKRQNVFYGMSKSKLSNGSSIPDSWATGMVE